MMEAQKRGTILLIVRMGNIDLQAPNTPAMDAPNPFMMQGPPIGPRALPTEPIQGMPNIVPPPDKKSDKGLPLPVPKPTEPKGDESSKPSVLPLLP